MVEELKKQTYSEPLSPDVMTDLRGFMTVEERKKMYNACDMWRDKVLIRLLWKSGRRITEILSLRVEDIDFENKKILWNILKKKKPLKRWKEIDDYTIELLYNYTIKTGQYGRSCLLFQTVEGDKEKPISRQRAFQIVRRIGKKVGITHVGEKKLHPHHFRHSFAVDLARRLKTPADVRKLQKVMEHSSLAITEQYLQFGDEGVRDLLDDD